MEYGPQLEISEATHAWKYRGEGESFKEAMNRIAGTLAPGDEFHEFRDILLDMRFMPAGRVQSAIGSTRQTTPYNCYVSGTIEDSYVHGHGSIMARASEAAQTMRMGGGIGYDFSTLRPRGDLIKKLQSQSSGPVSFMRIFDAVCRCTASSGHRRGAQMGVMRVDHPDIEEFVRSKQNNDKLTGFNMSIAVTDEFMEAVANDNLFSLRWGGKAYQNVKATALWDLIMRSTWDWAEPGVLFIDRINEMNNLWYCEEIAATNPCFTGDTKVWTAEHGHMTFHSLVGKTIDVLTQSENGRLVYRPMSVRMTKRDAQLVRVALDNESSVRCTPQHEFFLKDGRKVQACDLKPGDSIQSVYRYSSNQKGYMRLTNGKHQPSEHHIPFENVEGLGILTHVHHINEIRSDNRPSNLKLMDASEHMRQHMLGDKNPLRTHPDRNPMFLYPDCTRGEKNGRWREDLSTEQMLELRAEGLSYAAIAEKVGCSKYTAQKRIREANHRVVSVEWLDVREDVYCGTVEDPSHRFFIALGDNDGILVSNCGEQPLPPYGACLLGSFNLVKYVVLGDGTEAKHFNFTQFKKDIPKVVRAMDRVVDVATYPLYEQEQEAHSKRRMGLGVTGLANALECIWGPYGSPSFLKAEAEILRVLRDEAYRASAMLAKEKGAFSAYDKRKHQEGLFIRTLSSDVLGLVMEHGTRNSHLLSIAPTGTISLCADNISSGIEPVFDYEVDRVVETFDGPETYKSIPDYGMRVFGLYGKRASEVTAEEHLAVLAVATEFVDSSASKTCNVPQDIAWEDFKDIYMQAWKLNCKGCTTYRIGGKRGTVIESSPVEEVVTSCYIDQATGRHECE